MQLLAVILVCAATTTPPDCSRDTALDVMIAPASTPFACMMTGQVTLARDPEMVEGRYTRVTCERRKV
ncbi:hypothetical protein [Methylobacterium oxalidis]|uniref:Ribosomal protein S27 n=1 Tax=Methylobacterium oxalidis TaxID=944322 RepID=A0A512J259_9HYPH|nr:hypothetical protein [Methylobacterium oxalidis]GEP04044.1 hypothetical protein MOX02_20820 [Methylobacterium oxalidis]GJE34831.1 hypothetical protein LDDCCGHA_5046 [Methylobacterium oxalidis]GLS64075.1 hypothetical protein GCM10007888_24560 [Methylobacterium oxalidis]